jgi:hypothetical protein
MRRSAVGVRPSGAGGGHEQGQQPAPEEGVPEDRPLPLGKHGPEGVEKIRNDLYSVACWLIDTGDPDGKPSGPLAGRK